MDDYISLCDAQDAMTAENLIYNLDQVENGDAKRYARAAIRVLERLEPADVRPVKRGEFELIKELADGSVWKCSNCNLYYTGNTPPKINFCPNCGANMRPEGGTHG